MLKRLFDLALTLAIFLLAMPVLLLVAIGVRIFLGSPVLFVQRRTGMGRKQFDMIKFRTMTNETGADGKLLPNGQRMTRFGNFLRATSLDELPELFNVLKGEMSLVGPRPLLPEYDDLYSPEHARRLTVRPGLTGWAQVNGRSATSWSDRFDQDVWYVDRQTLWLDIKILFLTGLKVLSRSDVTTPDQNKRFQGYDS